METPVSTPAKIVTPGAPKRCKRKFDERRGLEVEDLVEKMGALLTGETPKNVPPPQKKRAIRKKLF
jgi:hypothetical protein